jgi:hypothetical protein
MQVQRTAMQANLVCRAHCAAMQRTAMQVNPVCSNAGNFGVVPVSTSQHEIAYMV